MLTGISGGGDNASDAGTPTKKPKAAPKTPRKPRTPKVKAVTPKAEPKNDFEDSFMHANEDNGGTESAITKIKNEPFWDHGDNGDLDNDVNGDVNDDINSDLNADFNSYFNGDMDAKDM